MGYCIRGNFNHGSIYADRRAGQQAGGAQDGQYYDADYKVVDDDDQNKK